MIVFINHGYGTFWSFNLAKENHHSLCENHSCIHYIAVHYIYIYTYTYTYTYAYPCTCTYTYTYIYMYIHMYTYIYISADPSHLQGERAREKVALTILLHSGGSSLASNASRRLRRRLLLHSGSSVKCPAAPLPEAFAAFWTLSKSFSSGFRKQR